MTEPAAPAIGPSADHQPIPNAVVVRPEDRGQVFLPLPTPASGDVDPDVFRAWKDYVVSSFKHLDQMFQTLLDAFMKPYWTTVWMYRAMFAVGLASFVAAVALGILYGPAQAAVFGGLSVVTFLSYFVSKPLQSLEENIQTITWLGVIYNSYWTRLMYANDPATAQGDIDAITKTAIDQLNALIDKHAALAGKRPGLTTGSTAANPTTGAAPRAAGGAG